jgi:hypothetical protein
MTAHFEAITAQANSDGVIKNVSVVTMGEAQGHSIWVDAEALAMFQKLGSEFPNGVKVKSKHKTSFDAIVGSLKNFHIEGEKLLADLHLIKSHAQFQHILELSEKLPGEFGLSAAFEYKKVKVDDKDFVRPVKITSVDLVDEPAANPEGLFSKQVDSNPINNIMTDTDKSLLESVKGWFSKAEKGFVPVETLSAAQTEVTTLKAELEAKGGELSILNIELAKAQGEVAKLNLEYAKSVSEHAVALEAKEADVEKRADAKAIEFSAAQGIKPLKADKAGGELVTVSRAEFSKLSSSEQMKLCKSGGKITD